MIDKILLTLLLLMLTGCDVPGIIHIVNRSPAAAYYIYEIADDDAARSDTIKISNVPKKNETSIMFGFGHRWTDEAIREYASRVRKIEIVSPADTIQLFTRDEIIEFFKNRRKGVFKNIIRIKIK